MSHRSWGATASVTIFWMIQISALAVFFVPFAWPHDRAVGVRALDPRASA